MVLLVSDCIDRQTLKEMTNVLFRMEFAAAILHQVSITTIDTHSPTMMLIKDLFNVIEELPL